MNRREIIFWMMGQAEGQQIKIDAEITEELELMAINNILTGAGELIITDDELLEFKKECDPHLADAFALGGDMKQAIEVSKNLDQIKDGT